MDNPILLMILVLAIAVMGGYYYVKRAQGRDANHVHDAHDRDDSVAH